MAFSLTSLRRLPALIAAPPLGPAGRRAAALGFAALACALFLPTLRFEFVYDDRAQILDNPWIWEMRFVPNLLTEAVWSFKGDQASNYFRPVQMFLYSIEAATFGREAWGFHLASVLTHALVAGAAWLLLFKVTTPGRAGAAALLFAVHPAHVESVAWIAGSTDLNCALLLFGALLAWSRALGEPRPGARVRFLAAAGVCSFLALLAKETAVVLPLLALLLPRPPEAAAARPEGAAGPGGGDPRDGRRRTVLLGLAFFAVALAAYAVMRHRAFGGPAGILRYPSWSAGQVVAAGLSLVPRYVAAAFFPTRLVPDRVFAPPAGIADPLVVAGAVIIAAAGFMIFRLRRRAPAAAFGAALLLLPLVPVLQVQLVGTNAQADRYLYIPSLGASLLIAEGAGALLRRLRDAAVRRRVALAACLVAAVAGAGRTLVESRVWKNDETLARAGIAREPRSATMHLLLSATLERAGRLPEAREIAAAAGAWDRNAAAVAAALAAQLEAGSPAEEAARLREQAAAYPGHPYILGNLAAAALRAGLYAEARDAATKALEADPRNVELLVNLASAHGGLDDRAGQERHALRALAVNPRFAPAWLSLGEARLARSDLRGGEEAARRAAALDPRLARAHVVLSFVAWRRGDVAAALRASERAVALDPADAGTRAWAEKVRQAAR